MLKIFKKNRKVVFECKSKFNDIKVIYDGAEKRFILTLDRTENMHSTKIQGRITSGSYWDICAISGVFLTEMDLFQHNQARITGNALILGVGAGTISTLMKVLAPHIKIYGVDIDEKVIEVGKKYFGMQCDFIVVADSFEFIRSTRGKFSAVVIDVFSDAKIPQDFFSDETWKELSDKVDKGVVMNTISLFQADDMKEVAKKYFDFGYVIKSPESSNYIFVAVKGDNSSDVLIHCYKQVLLRADELWRECKISPEDVKEIRKSAKMIYEELSPPEVKENVFVQGDPG